MGVAHMQTEAFILLGVIAAGLLVWAVAGYVYRNRASTGWQIGPILPDGSSTSKGYPVRPETPAGMECAFDFLVGNTKHVHYLTRDRGPISGTALRVRYRVTAAEGGFLYAQEGGAGAWVSIFLQRAGDDFTAVGDLTYWRWWALPPYRGDVVAGEFEIEVPLESQYWRHTMGDTGDEWFRQLLASKGRMGVTFGGPTGLGHGVCSSRPARFELLAFEVV